jgi:ABC-2 type transport system ATP-binding protein
MYMTIQQSSIQADKVVIKKGSSRVLDDLSFTVESGSITGLIGPSGSGKTTLMRAIVGVQKISSGSLTILEKPAGSSGLRRKIGYVTQDAATYADLTVVQNLRYFATLARSGKAQVDGVIEQVQLTDQRNQLVNSLSGGQRTRVSLAVALLGDPDLLVLDEPTVGLDPLLRQELWGLFSDLARQGKTLLISSHVMDEAQKCDALLLLRDGKLLWHDSRERLLQQTRTATVEAAFMVMITTKGVK